MLLHVADNHPACGKQSRLEVKVPGTADSTPPNIGYIVVLTSSRDTQGVGTPYTIQISIDGTLCAYTLSTCCCPQIACMLSQQPPALK